MLIYKIDDIVDPTYEFNDKNERKDNVCNNFIYMINLVIQNYKNYFKASEYLQSRYDFSLQAIYSCLSKVNNDENKLNSCKELSKFLYEVRQRAGLNMQIVKEKDTLYVKEKPKVKTKFRRAA